MHKVFQDVYENVQFAKLKLLARALERAQVYEGGRLVVSYLLRDDFAEVGAVEPYSEGIIDFLRAVEGADMAAMIREPPRGGGPARGVSLRASHDEIDVSAIARASGGGGHRQAAGFSSDASIEEITNFLRREFVAAAGAPPPADAAEGPRAERDHPRRQAGRALIVRDRRRVRSRTGTKMGHAGTLDPFATGLLLLLSGRSTKLAGSFVGLDKRYLTDVDLTSRTTTGDPEGEVVESLERALSGRARAAARGPPRRDRAADPGRVRGQDRR